jgi:hypothetical protein
MFVQDNRPKPLEPQKCILQATLLHVHSAFTNSLHSIDNLVQTDFVIYNICALARGYVNGGDRDGTVQGCLILKLQINQLSSAVLHVRSFLLFFLLVSFPCPVCVFFILPFRAEVGSLL